VTHCRLRRLLVISLTLAAILSCVQPSRGSQQEEANAARQRFRL
jgi:hypothetical protein